LAKGETDLEEAPLWKEPEESKTETKDETEKKE
jgi:hypothetical protein